MCSDRKIISGLCRVLVFSMGMLVLVAQAEVVVIVNPSNGAMIDKAVLKKLFLGRARVFPDGHKAVAIDLESGDVKKAFVKEYLQKDQGELDSYWSRMIFSGNGTPPKTYRTEDEIRREVAGNPEAIGYIDRSAVDDSVKVINIK